MKVNITKQLADLIKEGNAQALIRGVSLDRRNQLVMQYVLGRGDFNILQVAMAIQEGYNVIEYLDLSKVMHLEIGTIVKHASSFYSGVEFVVECDPDDGGVYLTFNGGLRDGEPIPFCEQMLEPKWYEI